VRSGTSVQIDLRFEEVFDGGRRRRRSLEMLFVCSDGLGKPQISYRALSNGSACAMFQRVDAGSSRCVQFQVSDTSRERGRLSIS